MSFDDFYSDQLVRYANIGIPIDEFGLPDMGSASRALDEKSNVNVGWGKEYGYPFSGPSMGDGYGAGPAEFLPQDGKMEYAPYAAYAINAGANSLVQGLNTPLGSLLGPNYIAGLPGVDMTDVGPDGGEYLQNNSRLDTGYGNRFARGRPGGRDGVDPVINQGDGFNERDHRAERMYRDQYGNSRSKGDTGRLAGPMRNPTGGRRPGENRPGKREEIREKATAPKKYLRDRPKVRDQNDRHNRDQDSRRKGRENRSEGFAVTGSRGTAPYPQAVDRTVNLYPVSGDDYHLERQLTKDARRRKQGGNLVDQETTLFAPNPRSKDYVFNNKHGILKVPNGFSMTSGTTITTDGDYGVNAGSTGMPHGGVTSGLGSVGNQYNPGQDVHSRDSGGNQGYTEVDAHPYIGYIPREKTVIQGGNNTTIFYDRVDSRHGIQGVYAGPPEDRFDHLDEGDAALTNAIGGDHPRNPITGELERLGIPSMFAKPNGTINNFHRNIRFIKDNPQVTELYGANTFELMSDGLHSGHRQHGIVANARKNIAGEQFDDRMVDLRFGNGTPYQYALTNGPGSTRRGIYLDMEVIKAVRPVTDYIFYLKTKGKIQPDMTDDFYFVTEEQYFSVQALDQHIVHNCLKRYNSGMIDVFKFLNYVFQFYFKHEKMTWHEFKIYSNYVDTYVKKQYGRALL